MIYSITIMTRTKRLSHDSHVAFRRQRLLVGLSTGAQIYELAEQIGCSESTLRRDALVLQTVARQEIASWVRDKMPLEFKSSLTALSVIKKRAFDIADNTTSDRDKLLALRLAADTEAARAKLLQEGPNTLAMQNLEARLQRIEKEETVEGETGTTTAATKEDNDNNGTILQQQITR